MGIGAGPGLAAAAAAAAAFGMAAGHGRCRQQQRRVVALEAAAVDQAAHQDVQAGQVPSQPALDQQVSAPKPGSQQHQVRRQHPGKRTGPLG